MSSNNCPINPFSWFNTNNASSKCPIAASSLTLCMNPGPIEFDHKVLKAMSVKGISHVDPVVLQLFSSVLKMCRQVFLTQEINNNVSTTYQPIVLTGSGTLGWDQVGTNLIQPQDKVLIVNTGYFGDRFGECLAVYGAAVIHVNAIEVGGCPTMSEVKIALMKEKSLKMVVLTHVDTSTGVVTDIEKMSTLIRSIHKNVLIVVDGVCALGGEETRMAAWDLDVVLTGSQKCLGVPAGLSILMASPRALKVYESLSQQRSPTSYYCNWKHWIPIMKKYELGQPSYFATPAVNHIFALHVALTQLLANGGMEARFNEYRLVSNAMKDAMQALGCTFVPLNREIAARTMTCVRFPAGVVGSDFMPQVVANGISLSGGLHAKIKSEYFRIGHMGISTRRLDHLVKTVTAIEAALKACGHTSFKSGAGVAKIKALKKTLPSINSYHGCPIGSFSTNPFQGHCPAPPACQVLTALIVISAFASGFLVATARSNARRS